VLAVRQQMAAGLCTIPRSL